MDCKRNIIKNKSLLKLTNPKIRKLDNTKSVKRKSATNSIYKDLDFL